MQKRRSSKRRPQSSITLSIPKETIFRVIDGETVIVKPQDSSMLLLNETGTFIFKRLLGDGLSFEELLKEISKTFEISEARARDDLRAFIKRLKKENIVITS